MTKEKAPTLTQSDTWILFSILSSDTPSKLTDIVAMGDAINHAILTFNELDHGLAALIRRALILQKDSLFEAVESVQNDFERWSSKSSDKFAIWRAIDRKYVGFIRSLLPRKLCSSLRYGLTRDQYDEVVKAYTGQFGL